MSKFDGSRGPPQIAGMTSLKVDNLTYRTSIEDLERYFDKYGDVGDIYIPRDRHRRESRGFAFVRYYEKRDAEDAIDGLDGHVIDGREIRVTLAKYDRPTDNVSRGGGGRRPYNGGGGGGGGRYGRSPPRRSHRDNGGRYERREDPTQDQDQDLVAEGVIQDLQNTLPEEDHHLPGDPCPLEEDPLLQGDPCPLVTGPSQGASLHTRAKAVHLKKTAQMSLED
eukprot:gene9238-10212_t